MTSQPPPMETATDPINSTADMHQRWRALMGPLGFGQRMLWVGFVGADHRMIKMLIDLQRPARPDPVLTEGLMAELAGVLADEMEPGTTVALLLSGPGSGPVSLLSRQWAESLRAAALDHQVPLQPIFSANDHDLVAVEAIAQRSG